MKTSEEQNLLETNMVKVGISRFRQTLNKIKEKCLESSAPAGIIGKKTLSAVSVSYKDSESDLIQKYSDRQEQYYRSLKQFDRYGRGWIRRNNETHEKVMRYMFSYQMTRITKDRGSLTHDDRLDVLVMAVQYSVDQMAANADQEIIDRKAQLLDQELDKFINGINTSKYCSKTDTWTGL